MQALQLRQAQEQYRQTRQRLRADLQETEAALLRGVMPSALALQPAMRAPALGNGQACGHLLSLAPQARLACVSLDSESLKALKLWRRCFQLGHVYLSCTADAGQVQARCMYLVHMVSGQMRRLRRHG